MLQINRWEINVGDIKQLGTIQSTITEKSISRDVGAIPERGSNGNWIWWDDHGYEIAAPKSNCECESMGCCSETSVSLECCDWDIHCCVWEDDSFKCKICPE